MSTTASSTKCRHCAGSGYIYTSTGNIPCHCNRFHPRRETPAGREMEMILVGYENMGPESDYEGAVADLCKLLRIALGIPTPPQVKEGGN